MGQGRDRGSAARLGQQGPSWDPLQARPQGDRGQGTSTGDTTTPRARRNKKTILTHRGDTFCADGIQAAARQGGVQIAAIGRWGTERDTGKKRKTKARTSVPTLHTTLYRESLRCCLGPTAHHAQSHPTQDTPQLDLWELRPPLWLEPAQRVPLTLPPSLPSCQSASASGVAHSAPSPGAGDGDGEQGRRHLVSWIHWWNALACWANSCRSLSFSSCRRCSFCSSSSRS